MDDIDYNLMVPVYLPFDYTDPSTYSIVYTTVVVMFTYVSYFVMVYDILIQVYLMQLLCQFAVLQDCFTNVLSDCAEDFKGTLLFWNLLRFKIIKPCFTIIFAFVTFP